MFVQNSTQPTYQSNHYDFNKNAVDTKQETLDNLQKIQEAANLLVKAVKSPARTSTAFYTLINGFSNLMSGHVISGTALTGIAGIELYMIFSENQTLNLKELLEDTGAGLDMIKNLENESAKNLLAIKENLLVVDEGINALSAKLESIDRIATEGNERLVSLKADAASKSKIALESQKKALEKLLKVQSQLESGHQILEEARMNIEALQEKAREPASDNKDDLIEQVEDLQDFADAAVDTFKKADQLFNKSSSLMLKGMKLFQKAANDQVAATEAAVRAITSAENTIVHIVDESKYLKELKTCQDAKQIVDEKLEELLQLNKEKDFMLNDAIETNKEAQEQIAFGTQSVILGGGFGAAVGPTLGIPSFVSAPLGVAVYHEFHNGGTVSKVCKSAWKCFKGAFKAAPPVVNRPPEVKTANLSFTFDDVSTGWFGWARGLHSSTQGTLKLSLKGKPIFECTVNFNRDKPMRVSDINKLTQELNKQIQKDPSSAAEAKKLLDELSSTRINRTKNKQEQSFISNARGANYFGQLYRSINKILAI